ncbi:MAG: hypothetical protein ACTSQE_14905 [Candidatus Heimdallarchaeaceae archaeon]
MRPISPKIKKHISEDEFYEVCCREEEGDCDGGITMEHALIYAGRQIDEIFAIIPVCEYHHGVNQYQGGGKLDKKKHEWIAISRMTTADRIKYSKRPWMNELRLLENKFGKYQK